MDARVDRRRLARGMLIDRRLFRNEGIDVGDAYHHLDAAVGKAFGKLDLIEIARSVVVDRRPQKAAQIADTATGADLRRIRFQRRQLLGNFRGKVGWKPRCDMTSLAMACRSR